MARRGPEGVRHREPPRCAAVPLGAKQGYAKARYANGGSAPMRATKECATTKQLYTTHQKKEKARQAQRYGKKLRKRNKKNFEIE